MICPLLTLRSDASYRLETLSSVGGAVAVAFYRNPQWAPKHHVKDPAKFQLNCFIHLVCQIQCPELGMETS